MDEIEYDPFKDNINQRRHGVSLDEAWHFEWASVFIQEDRTKRHSEYRYRAIGFLKGPLHVLVFTMRDERLRPISLRQATSSERRKWPIDE